MKRFLLVLPLTLLLAAPASGATLLRLDGIGPLKLGMSRTAGLDTGWLSNRMTGCELGGKPYPIGYKLAGTQAPAGLDGIAEFNRGKLTSLVFDAGVRTATGVVPGKTTVAGMVKRYRDAGFKASARYDDVFAATFVTVKRKGGKQVIFGYASGKVVDTIGIPFIPFCE
jgi:hypothetical protein